MAKGDDMYYAVRDGVVQKVSGATVKAAFGGLGKLAKLCKEGFTIFEVKGK